MNTDEYIPLSDYIDDAQANVTDTASQLGLAIENLRRSQADMNAREATLVNRYTDAINLYRDWSRLDEANGCTNPSLTQRALDAAVEAQAAKTNLDAWRESAAWHDAQIERLEAARAQANALKDELRSILVDLMPEGAAAEE
jgi:hypothetical protein